jgi:hypothetical protein
MQPRDVQIQNHKDDLVSGVIRMAKKPFQGAKPVMHYFQANVRSEASKSVAGKLDGDRIILYKNYAVRHGRNIFLFPSNSDLSQKVALIGHMAIKSGNSQRSFERLLSSI